MIQDRYRKHAHKASAMIQHLGRAVRGSRAFFVFRDRSDPSQAQIIACHPPLSDEALLRCLDSEHVVCESVSEDASHQAFVGIASDAAFDNEELAHEMTSCAAHSLASDIDEEATVDESTGLPDRDSFVMLLAERIEQDADGHNDVAILKIEIDRFHRVLASFGDEGGETLMRVIAQRLASILDSRSVIARLSVDRFGVLLPREACVRCETPAGDTAALVHAALRQPIEVDEQDIFVTASVGIAVGTQAWRPGNLLHDAGMAIAMAKSTGGGGTHVFRAGMDNLPAAQLLRERDVRLAVSRDEFTVHFQPIVGAMLGGLHAFEALLRWRNPNEGILPPSTFLDVLHETGLIDIVGRRVIRESCEHAARWLALSGALVPVSVNIAPVQLYADDFCDDIARTLCDTGLPAEGLILELTENAFIDDAVKVRQTLRDVRDLGVKVMIDDFGTGYSSLSYLHELPVSGIKLDRQWFRAIETCETQREIVRTIVGLAHYMHMEVVAEGIESATQLRAARDLQCDFAQGFCFARPFDAEHATRYLATNLSRGAKVA
jgi:diguanylate cyclase (GGDEF)-like protein